MAQVNSMANKSGVTIGTLQEVGFWSSSLNFLEHIVISLDHLKTKLSLESFIFVALVGKLLLKIFGSHQYNSNIK